MAEFVEKKAYLTHKVRIAMQSDFFISNVSLIFFPKPSESLELPHVLLLQKVENFQHTGVKGLVVKTTGVNTTEHRLHKFARLFSLR